MRNADVFFALFAEEPVKWFIYRFDGSNNIVVQKGFANEAAANARKKEILDPWTKPHGQDFFVASYTNSGWKALVRELHLLE